MNKNIRFLVTKQLKISYKNNWFKKLILICVVAYIVATVVVENILLQKFFAADCVKMFFNVIFLKMFVVDTFLKKFFSTVVEFKKFFLIVVEFEKLFSIVVEFEKLFINVFSSTLLSTLKIILFNNVIIHNFNVANFFVKIIKKFLTLWNDIGFAKLFKKNWMRISLKFDWKNKIFDKIKIYSLKTKNKTLMNNIFDELYWTKKFFWINESTLFSYLIFCVWKNVINENDEPKKKSNNNKHL